MNIMSDRTVRDIDASTVISRGTVLKSLLDQNVKMLKAIHIFKVFVSFFPYKNEIVLVKKFLCLACVKVIFLKAFLTFKKMK
jgi:hypothetical protein